MYITAHTEALVSRHLRVVAAVEGNFTRHGVLQLLDRTADGGFTRADSPTSASVSSRVNIETHFLDGTQAMGGLAEQVLADVEPYKEIFNREKRLLIVLCRVLDTLFAEGDRLPVL